MATASTSRFSSAAIVAMALAAPLAAADDWFDQDHTQNRTVWRERIRVIPSVYDDVRRDVAGIPSPYEYPNYDSQVNFWLEDYRLVHRTQSWLVHDPADPPVVSSRPYVLEHRQEATATWRQSWTSNVATEVSLAGARRSQPITTTYAGAWSWGDLHTRLLLPVWRGRYSAVTIVVGSSHPTGASDDPTLSHGSWTPEIGLRANTALGFVVITADGSVEASPWASNDTGSTIGTIDNRYVGANGAVAMTWRATTWLRFGLTQRANYQRWDVRNGARNAVTPTSVTVARYPTMALADLTLWGVNLGLAGGADGLAQRDLSIPLKHRATLGANINFHW